MQTSMLKKTYFFLCKCRDIAIIAILAFIVGLVAVQVILRYFTAASLRPFAWGDELIRNLSVWVFFLGGSLAAREGAHISIDFIVKKLFKGKGRWALDKAAGLVVLAVLGMIIVVGARQALGNPAKMVNLRFIPMTCFYLAIPVGSAYIFIDYLLITIFGCHPFSDKARIASAEAKEG